MREKTLNLSLVLFTSLCGISLLLWWMLYNPVGNFSVFVPGLDNRPDAATLQTDRIDIGGFFAWYGGKPSAISGSWPRFRGADYDNISKEGIKLAGSWGETGPAQLWSIELGEGHAGPVVSEGRVYVMDYDEENRRDILRCFSLEDGKEIWQRGYDIFIKRNHGMSRTVPAVKNGYVVTMGPMCQVMCVDADSGQFKWGIDLEQEYNSEVPLWYTGQCPLIEDSIAVIAVGGTVLMLGVHCETGEVVWETPNSSDVKMSHSSIIPMELHGQKIYVYSALGGLFGVSAEKETRGQILFENKEWNHSVVAPSPVYAGNNRILVTAGYGAGSMLFEVVREQDQFSVHSIQTIEPDEGLASEQQTPVYYKDHLFAILPKDAGALRNQFVCTPADDPGKILWSSGKTNRFGLGPYLIADGKFYLLSDEGALTVLEARTDRYEPLTEIEILDGHDAWGPMAVVNGRLLARDSKQMVCLDIRANQ